MSVPSPHYRNTGGVLSEAARERVRRSARGWFALAAAFVVLATSAAVFAGFAVARSDANQSRQAFAAASADIASTLQLAIQHEEDLIVSARGFVVGNPHASEAQFLQWANSVQTLTRYPELSGFGYAVIVRQADLAAFEARSLAAPPGVVSPDGRFHVIPAGRRPFYCFTRLGQVRGDTGAPVGMDFCDARGGAAGSLQARDSGQGSYIPLRIGTTTSLSVSVPVYRGGTVPATVALRRQAFLGWIGMSFSPSVLLDRALRGRPSMSVTMRYRVGTSDASFSSGPATASHPVTTDLHNGWTITSASTAASGGLLASRSGLAVLIAGIMVSLLLGMLMYILGTGRGRALRLVARKTVELQHMAMHDTLTGLPNRALILDRADQAMARARRDNTEIGLMFLDLDGFKGINDTFGHATGDELLCAVAARLTGLLRTSDTVGRLGGDEFVVLTEGSSLDDGVERVAERIRNALAEPFVLSHPETRTVYTHVSIGIATGVRASADDLLRDADVALYEAKDAGKDCSVVFAPPMQTAVEDKLQLEMDLRSSVGTAEFFLVYQPTFDLRHVTITGAEALLRWQHPTRGLVMPDTFIPVAEQTGVIVPLGSWVLAEACRQAVNWQRRGQTLAVSVNVSARQVDTGPVFLATLREILAETGLDPGLLTLEITESMLMRDAPTSAQQLHDLKQLGVRIAIDDFGTGYSSLAYLQRFPVDALKIDRSFVNRITDSPESVALIRTLVQLGRTLGIQTVAEGIEEPAQLEALQQQGCDSGQGYLFSRPLTLPDLDAFIGLSAPVINLA
jgi:diguanylate cyclase (GGDEF)-like protein